MKRHICEWENIMRLSEKSIYLGTCLLTTTLFLQLENTEAEVAREEEPPLPDQEPANEPVEVEENDQPVPLVGVSIRFTTFRKNVG